MDGQSSLKSVLVVLLLAFFGAACASTDKPGEANGLRQKPTAARKAGFGAAGEFMR